MKDLKGGIGDKRREKQRRAGEPLLLILAFHLLLIFKQEGGVEGMDG